MKVLRVDLKWGVGFHGIKAKQSKLTGIDELKKVFKNLEKASTGMDTTKVFSENYKSLDVEVRKASKKLLKMTQQRIIEGRAGFKSLSIIAQTIRGYLRNPNTFAKDLLERGHFYSSKKNNEKKFVYFFSDSGHKKLIKDRYKEDAGIKRIKNAEFEAKYQNSLKEGKEISFEEFEKRIKDHCAKLPGIKFHPKSKIGGPPLLRSGNLVNSLSININKSHSKSPKGKKSIFGRELEFSTSAPYAKEHFAGSAFKGYKLVITKSSRSQVKIFIPELWKNSFKNLNLGPQYQVSVESEVFMLPKRNPFDEIHLDTDFIDLLEYFGDINQALNQHVRGLPF